MRADLLLDHFDTLVRTPEDVAGLELGILNLAVRGQLIPQDSDDEPATKLLKRIKAEKKRFRPIQSDEIPYELPGDWAWARLGEVFELEYGKSLPKKERDSDGDVAVYGSNGVIGHHSKALVFTPCIVVGRKGSSGAVNLAQQPCWVIDTAFFVRPPDGVDIAFSFHLLRSLGLESLAKGIKPGLNRNEAYKLPVGIPPLAEQKRIVAKVESLLAQTHALAAQLQAADEALVPAAQASFQALTDAPDRASQSEAWQRISSAFDALTSDPRTIDALKQTVLQLAVQGRLVPQDPDDEPASVLLKRIKAEKKQLVKEGELRKERPLAPIKPDDIPFGVPASWGWVRLGDLARFIDYRGKTPTKVESGMPLITAKNVRMGYVNEVPREYVDPAIYESWMTRGIPRKGDVLFTTEAPLGNVALLHTEDQVVLAQRIITLQPYADMHSPFLMFALMSAPVRSVIFEKATGTTARGIKASRFRTTTIPIPPLPEQKRIVAKVESLLALCDKLAAEVVAAEEVRRRLLAAVLNGE